MRETALKRPLAIAHLSIRPLSLLLGAGLLWAAGSATATADDSLFFAEPEFCPKDIIDIPKIVNDAAGLDPNTQEIVLESTHRTAIRWS